MLRTMLGHFTLSLLLLFGISSGNSHASSAEWVGWQDRNP